ncbi:acetoacetate decarboxylase family protein [Streptomyces atratus]|uniref:acetoacetate decarboxylase family protein n=1 Tax=Streptomyces atratus TaxID=1893 RepID=UPI0022504D18|nr:acetoacetate decarboxylase family protein [Streptomyces atratus]MCX5346022.1 acetoacetate decarboxylase family protein [Streptomyces atratus]
MHIQEVGQQLLTVTYRTDRHALDRLAPEPLHVAEPTVRFEVMRMPGLSNECGTEIPFRVGFDVMPRDRLPHPAVQCLADSALRLRI